MLRGKLSVVDIIAALASKKRRTIFEIICRKGERIALPYIASSSGYYDQEVQYHLERLVATDLVRVVDSDPIMNPRTGKPIYRFYGPSESGSFIFNSYNSFQQDIEKVVRWLGFDPEKEERAYESGIKVRLKIIKRLNESDEGLSVDELLKELKPQINTPSTLTHHLYRLRNVVEYIEDKMDRRIHRYRLTESIPTELLMLLDLSKA